MSDNLSVEDDELSGNVGGGQDEDPVTPVSTAERDARRWRLLRSRTGTITVCTTLAVLFAATLASTIVLFQQNQDKQQLLDARKQAGQAACAYGPVVSTYDSKNLDLYRRAVLGGATGDWKKEFESTSQDIGAVLVQGNVVAKADDVQCAIRDSDQTSAEALVVIGQTITSAGTNGQPQKGQLSIVMRLEKDGNRWLVDKIQTPLAPPRP